MNKNVILLIIIVVLIGLVGYLILAKKPETPQSPKSLQPATSSTTQTVSSTPAKKVIIGFLKAKQSRDFEKAKPFLSSDFAKTVDAVDFAGTSNPHTGRFEIQDMKLLPDGKTYKVSARVYQEYTGEGEIGYNDNSYYVKPFGDRYLIDNIEYGKYVELPKEKTSATVVNWKNLLPTIQKVIGTTFLGVRVGEHPPMNIWQTSDITGDGVPEALVYLGEGGAYTSYLTLMRIENDKPVVVQFKQKDGKISALMFLSGASVMNGEAATMLPEKNAIYAGHWSRSVSGEPYGGLTNCKVEAYQWNPQTKIFDFSQNLSNEIRQSYCQKAGT